MAKSKGLSAIIVLVLIIGGLLIFGPMIGLGGVLEQTWSWFQDVGSGADATGTFTWGIKASSGSPAGSILSGGTEYDDGQVTVYGAGRLLITGAQTVSSSINYNVRVVPVGSTSPVASAMAFTGTVSITDKGGGTFESGLIQFQKDYCTYADLGIPNVGDSRSLELYVSLGVTVDGVSTQIYSGSTTHGGKASVGVSHTSDAAISFSWSNPPSLDWS